MKQFIKILASIVLIPLFLLTLFSGSVKYQLLNDEFLVQTFEKHGVYNNLQIEVISYLNSKNANIAPELITSANIKDFVDKNIVNVLNFLKGNITELKFYIPVAKIPKEYLPKKLGTLEQEMTAKELMEKFNISGVDPIIYDQFKITGKVVNYIFYVFLVIAFFVAFFVFPLAPIFIGIVLIAQNYFVKNIYLGGNKIVEIMATPVIYEISKTWSIVGMLLVTIYLLIFVLGKVNKKNNG